MSVRHLFSFVAIAIACIAPLPAVAGSKTVFFTGTVDSLFFTTGGPGGSPAHSGYDESFSVGSPFSGSLTLNDVASDVDLAIGAGAYRFEAPPWSAVFQVGNFTFSASSPAISYPGFEVYVNDQMNGVDRVLIEVPGASVIRAPASYAYMRDSAFYITLRDDAAAALASDDLASVPFTLGAWSSASIEFRAVAAFAYPADFHATGTLLTMTSVPEPSAASLLALGVAGSVIGVLGFRRARS